MDAHLNGAQQTVAADACIMEVHIRRHLLAVAAENPRQFCGVCIGAERTEAELVAELAAELRG